MLVDRINIKKLDKIQKDPEYDQPIKFIYIIDHSREDYCSEYNFDDDIVIINLEQVNEDSKDTKVHQDIVLEYKYIHEIGHKNDDFLRKFEMNKKRYSAYNNEILEKYISIYLKIENYANDYANCHKPSNIRKEDWDILHDDYIKILNNKCNEMRNKLNLSFLLKDKNVEFSDKNINEIKKQFGDNVSIKENIIKILKIS